ncbi:hypothetical protein SCHPADRAFT_909700 [Schizopora paradoxa]|uniref:BTB domain-containing protein n=1 Tax=Schizopora paradoxa TaxID=27342 RepID=A0A0H2R5Z9_9AGAM|nr:hypothetical protein SCHPADRAFT_909700 [Schizopora paradoxa]
MPPKRRRTSESSSSNDDGKRTAPQPHDKLWFDDGNIVLATDVHLYRVFKGILAKYSKVLSDIFEMPTGGAAECWEDVPMVQMVGDKDEEVSVLLRALFERNFRDSLKDLETPELCSLLAISTKYDFVDIRAEVMGFLETAFPNKQENLSASDEIWDGIPDAHLFELIVVAHKCEALSILPFLYYLCASYSSIEVIIGVLHKLPNECMKRLLRCRDWLCGLSQSLVKLTLQPSKAEENDTSTCENETSYCSEQLRVLLDKMYPEETKRFLFIFDMQERGVLGTSSRPNGVCENCVSSYLKRLDELIRSAWTKLPEVILGKKWEEICTP